MKKHIAFIGAAGIAIAFASPALAECSYGAHASAKQSDVIAMDKTTDDKLVKTDEAMSTFDPPTLKTDDAETSSVSPSVEKIVSE